MTHGLLFGVLLFAGCPDSFMRKSLPAPLRSEEHYTLQGRPRRMWGGDNFEFGNSLELHYIVIRGIDTPKPGQELYGPARSAAWNRIRKRQIRVEVYGKDEMMREIADVYVPQKDGADVNLGLELLRLGWGWYDGNEFELAESYRQAELEAREKKIGIWATENPIAPWAFESQQQEDRKTKLDQNAHESR